MVKINFCLTVNTTNKTSLLNEGNIVRRWLMSALWKCAFDGSIDTAYEIDRNPYRGWCPTKKKITSNLIRFRFVICFAAKPTRLNSHKFWARTANSSLSVNLLRTLQFFEHVFFTNYFTPYKKSDEKKSCVNCLLHGGLEMLEYIIHRTIWNSDIVYFIKIHHTKLNVDNNEH